MRLHATITMLVLLSAIALATPLQVVAKSVVSLPLIPYQDPWQRAKPRFRDINELPFYAWINSSGQSNGRFRYTSRQVRLTYDPRPAAPRFMGWIAARGLKPNFCYQMKLLGKPVYGIRGWGPLYGDDVANERLGRAGRWWDEDVALPQTTNLTDSYYRNVYLNRPARERHSVVGYLYLGAFVTDENGNYCGPVGDGQSYHVTWQSWQSGSKHVVAVRRPFIRTSNYGYGPPARQIGPTTLFYEYENGRPQPVRLPPGTYRCRFLLTEESFHNDTHVGLRGPDGGYWLSVLANEDFRTDGRGTFTPDTNPSNDIVFTIRPDAPSQVSATAADRRVHVAWIPSSGATRYRVKRSVGGPRFRRYTTLTDVTTNTFSDDAVRIGTTYSYVVSAVNAAGESANSRAVQVIPVAANKPPVGVIVQPDENLLYIAGEAIRYEGRGTDPEDGVLSPSSLSWRIDLHLGEHVYPGISVERSTATGSFTPPTTGGISPTARYRIHLTVTDSAGLTHSSYRDVLPTTSLITLATEPPGLELGLDFQPRVAPYSTPSVVGTVRTLIAPPQNRSGRTYFFDSWSNGGSPTQNVSTSSSNMTYTARFRSCPTLAWQNGVNVEAEANSLRKTSRDYGWNAGAASTTAIVSGDGFAAITVAVNRFERAFGLNQADEDQNWTNIDFGFFMRYGQLKVVENGVTRAESYCVQGDLLRVAIEGGAIKYYRNNTVLYTNMTPSLRYPLFLDTALLHAEARIDHAVLCGENLGTVTATAGQATDEMLR